MESWREELYENELYHHGILGQKWGVRRFQNEDGSVTRAGARRYYDGVGFKGNGWGKPKGEGGGGGGGANEDDREEEDEEEKESVFESEEDKAKAQSVVDASKAKFAERVERLKDKAKNRVGEEGEEEKDSKSSSNGRSSGSSSRSAGASMTAEQVAQALAKILGEDVSSTPKTEVKQEPEEEERPEENLDPEVEQEVSNYVVDPITQKVYKKDPDSDGYIAVDPKTGKEEEGEPVKLQKSKLESLLETVRSGAENFRSTLRTIVQNISNRMKSNSEDSEEYNAAKKNMIDKEYQPKNAEKINMTKTDKDSNITSRTPDENGNRESNITIGRTMSEKVKATAKAQTSEPKSSGTDENGNGNKVKVFNQTEASRRATENDNSKKGTVSEYLSSYVKKLKKK